MTIGVHCKLKSVIIHRVMLDKINRTFIVPTSLANERLDQALTKLMPDYSRTQIQEWLENGHILVNGNLIKAKTRIKGGENILVSAPITAPTPWAPEEIPLSIVFEDDSLMVINKPVGMVVHPGAGNSKHTLLNALLHHDPTLQLLPRAGILHRLDKDTSGLLVIAKTNQALKSLSHQLKKRTILREYQAIVNGDMISGGEISAPIGRHHKDRKRMTVTEAGKKAVTHYRIMEKYRAHTRLCVRLETGRTHQIRVHMAYIHHPIVGDPTYGRVQLQKNMSAELIQFLRQFKRQALHAATLQFTHPVTGELCRFEAKIPDDMQQLIQILKSDAK